MRQSIHLSTENPWLLWATMLHWKAVQVVFIQLPVMVWMTIMFAKTIIPELPIIVPVDNHGKMTAEAGEQFAGLSTDEASRAIGKHLEEIGAMFAAKRIVHQYPALLAL